MATLRISPFQTQSLDTQTGTWVTRALLESPDELPGCICCFPTTYFEPTDAQEAEHLRLNGTVIGLVES